MALALDPQRAGPFNVMPAWRLSRSSAGGWTAMTLSFMFYFCLFSLIFSCFPPSLFETDLSVSVHKE